MDWGSFSEVGILYMTQSGIYGIHNTANGKWYIGQSIDLDKRRRGHFLSLRNGYHFNAALQADFSKHGEDSFEWHVIELVVEGALDTREQTWIAQYRSTEPDFGYNLESGGHENKHHSEETKRHLSEIRKGRKLSEEHRKKIGLAGIGRHPTQETREKLSAWQRGRKRPPFSEEWKRHIGEGHRGIGHPQSDESRVKLSESHKNSEKARAHQSELAQMHVGTHHSDESKDKISAALKGRIPWNKGKTLSETHRQKITEGLLQFNQTQIPEVSPPNPTK